MGNLFTGPHLIIVLFIILLLFGAPKLPGLAKSLGQSMRILKKEVSSDKDKSEGVTDSVADGGVGDATPQTPTQASTQTPAQTQSSDADAEKKSDG